MRRFMALGALITTLLSVGGLTATTAWADASALQVSVAYDKATYNSDGMFTVTLTITNNSDQDETGLDAFGNGPCVAGVFSWPKLGFGFTVPAHGTVTDTETGGNPIEGGLGGTATCSGVVADHGTNIPYRTTAVVNQVFGDYHGVLFLDRNHDGMFEPGEGVDGITAQFTIVAAPNSVVEQATSGPDGRLTLTHVPVGTYGVEYTSHHNWVVGDPTALNSGAATVTEAGAPTQFLVVTQPLSARLKVEFGFDQTSYQPTDTAHLTVTMTNTGKQAITGVIADCNRAGAENGLFSFDGWGALSSSGPGATVPAGTTVTFHVDQPMPAGAQTDGYVDAPCVFGPEPDGNPLAGFPGGEERAKVPGLLSPTVVGFVRSDDTTVPVTGLKVRIVDEVAKQVVTVATTDANGQISLPALPAGLYSLHPLRGFTIPLGQSNLLTARSPGGNVSYEVTPPTG